MILDQVHEDAIQTAVLKTLFSGVGEDTIVIETLDPRLFRGKFSQLFEAVKFIRRKYHHDLTPQALDWYLTHVSDLPGTPADALRLFYREVSASQPSKTLQGKNLRLLLAELRYLRRVAILLQIGEEILDGVEDPATLDDTVDKVCSMSYEARQFGEDHGVVRRRFIHEEAEERLRGYDERGEVQATVYPLGFPDIDCEIRGGARPGHLILFVGDPGGGKTRTLLNVGYNMSRLSRIRALYVTIEMALEDLELLYDSRDTLLDYTDIDMGRLSDIEREKLEASLLGAQERRDSFYIVDIPSNVTASVLEEEVKLYIARFGQPPEVLLADYANLMTPTGKLTGAAWSDQMEVFKELHAFARSQRIAVVTGAQRNPQGEVGLSYLIKPQCDVIIEIDLDEIDEVTGIARMSFKKNRFGRKPQNIELQTDFARSFIGNRRIRVGGR